MQFTGEVTSVVVEINRLGLYLAMIGRFRQLSEPRLRQQAEIEKSQTPVERDILVQWVRNKKIVPLLSSKTPSYLEFCVTFIARLSISVAFIFSTRRCIM